MTAFALHPIGHSYAYFNLNYIGWDIVISHKFPMAYIVAI